MVFRTDIHLCFNFLDLAGKWQAAAYIKICKASHKALRDPTNHLDIITSQSQLVPAIN